MKIIGPVLCFVAIFGTGCAMLPAAALPAISDLPNCLESNYDSLHDLFTLNTAAGEAVNQQCLLTVVERGTDGPVTAYAAGRYAVYLSNGGGGGAGGTMQTMAGGGGGGGGGAGARETRVELELVPGVYVLTIGAGGAGGHACSVRPFVFGGGPGALGSPTNMVQAATGTVVAGRAGAEAHVRLTRAQNEKLAGEHDAHGGSGPGQSGGGHGSRVATSNIPAVAAAAGQGTPGAQGAGSGGAAGALPANKTRPGGGGGGGATRRADGGDGGGSLSNRHDVPPQHGTLGSGGGGEGNAYICDPGGRGGHGYVALRPL